MRKSIRRGRRTGVVTLATAAAVTVALATLRPGGETAAAFSYAPIFKNPGAMVIDPLGHLWVANSDRFGITEVDARTGRVLRLVREPGYTLNDPIALVVTRGDLWIANAGVGYASGKCSGGRIAILNDRTAALVRLVDLRPLGLHCLSSMATDGTHVWVSGSGGGRLVELSAATGAVERRIYRAPDLFRQGGALAIADGRLWYAYQDGVAERWAGSGAWIGLNNATQTWRAHGQSYNVVVELQPLFLGASGPWMIGADSSGRNVRRGDSISFFRRTTGRLARVEQPLAAGFMDPSALVCDSTHAWVANQTSAFGGVQQGKSVIEFNTRTGRVVQSFYIEDGPYSSPAGLAIDGSRLFVSDLGGDNVLEYYAATGQLVRVIGPPAPTGYSPT